MNEQLIVKNFGPIKDATVDFKKVTVFIGPTGGGKSTLAKLAAIFRDSSFHLPNTNEFRLFNTYNINSYLTNESLIIWTQDDYPIKIENKTIYLPRNIIEKTKEAVVAGMSNIKDNEHFESLFTKYTEDIYKNNSNKLKQTPTKDIYNDFIKYFTNNIVSKIFKDNITKYNPQYFPAERVFVAGIEYSWAGLMRDDIGLSKTLLSFANSFSLARKDVPELKIPFLNVTYLHIDGRDFIKIPGREELLMLLETASGIQSVTPLLVLLEKLQQNKEQSQSFIIEEPELNLFPIAQFELTKTLIDKCARSDNSNSLALTTHSPYVLTALNLLCYAYRIGQQDENTAKKVAKLIPRKYWIDPDQFAAYYVDTPNTKQKQQVRSIINKKTGLIEENELDNASEELSSIFDKLLRLRQPSKPVAKAAK